MRYKNLILLGTSHIAEQSLREVEEAIEKEKQQIEAARVEQVEDRTFSEENEYLYFKDGRNNFRESLRLEKEFTVL